MHAYGHVSPGKSHLEGPGTDSQTFATPHPSQRAIRVRSHSMETMVGSQRKLHGGNIPGSLSGGSVHNSVEVTKTTFSVSTLDSGPACGGGGGRKGVFHPRFGLGTLKLLNR